MATRAAAEWAELYRVKGGGFVAHLRLVALPETLAASDGNVVVHISFVELVGMPDQHARICGKAELIAGKPVITAKGAWGRTGKITICCHRHGALTGFIACIVRPRRRRILWTGHLEEKT